MFLYLCRYVPIPLPVCSYTSAENLPPFSTSQRSRASYSSAGTFLHLYNVPELCTSSAELPIALLGVYMSIPRSRGSVQALPVVLMSTTTFQRLFHSSASRPYVYNHVPEASEALPIYVRLTDGPTCLPNHQNN